MNKLFFILSFFLFLFYLCENICTLYMYIWSKRLSLVFSPSFLAVFHIMKESAKSRDLRGSVGAWVVWVKIFFAWDFVLVQNLCECVFLFVCFLHWPAFIYLVKLIYYTTTNCLDISFVSLFPANLDQTLFFTEKTFRKDVVSCPK